MTKAATTAPWRLYSGRQRAGFLAALFLIGTSSYIDRNIIGVLLEPIKVDLGISDTRLGLLTGLSFALFYATLGLPIARLADRGNRKTVITISLVVWSMMTALCGLAQNFWQLALARVGVGAGEAGAIPAAQSLISDYYPPERRAGAIGIFMLSAMAGNVIGLVVGGWIAQHHGWRAAFLWVGIPGIALALVSHFGLREPRREVAAPPPLPTETTAEAFAALYAKPAYRWIVGAMILYWLMAYGALIFTPSLMIRVHGLDVARAGAIYGTVSAIGAAIGTLGSGWLSGRLARRDTAWLARLPGIALILLMPIYQAAYLVPTVAMMTGILLAGTILLTGAVPPLFAALQHVCGPQRRASAVAIAFFFANLIGLGLGPLMSGALSDTLAVRLGSAEGLRWALVIIMATFVPAGLCLLRAARHLVADGEDAAS